MKLKQLVLIIPVLFFSFGLSAHGNQESDYHFTENLGQLDQRVKYHCKLHIGDVYFGKSQFTFDLYSGEDIDRLDKVRHHAEEFKRHGKTPFNLRKHAYSMKFIGANENNKIVTAHKLPFYKNYIRGNNPKRWQSKVSSYEKISYLNLYDNINIDVYSINEHLKYDYIVKKGGNPNDILVQYDGVEKLELQNGMLKISMSTGVVKELRPVAYQNINGSEVNVPCKFEINGNEVTFKFPNGYNTAYELVIDPTWVFSSLTGSTADNWGFTATYDGNGNFYGGGIAFANGYPTTVGAYSVVFGGNVDAVITKFNPSGTALIYSTYIGGLDADQPHSLVTDADSNLVVLGVTASSNFPTTVGAFQTTFLGGPGFTEDGITYGNGTDIFVLKLDNQGAALLGSTFLGGSSNDGFSLDLALKYNYADHARGEVVLDTNNNIYIASSTSSTNFPTTPGSHSQTLFGGFDGIAAKLSPNLTTLNWSTYIGGTGADAGYSVRVDELNNRTFVCGGTSSNSIGVTPGALGQIYSGATDGYIAKFDNTNGALSAMTYLGTTSYDQAYILELDDFQDVYVVGQTNGNYPVTPGVYTNIGANQFIHKLDNNLTTTAFSTVFGSINSPTINISLTAFLIDDCDNIYVGGWGGSVNGFGQAGGNTNNMPITGNALQSTTDGSDFYFIVLDRNAQNLLYGTYFGSSGPAEHVDGGTSRFDPQGTIYQGVCAACGNTTFPTSPGAYSANNGSTNCNFGAIKIELNFQGVNATATVPPNITLCGTPYTVNFTGNVPPTPNNYWDFGDGIGTSTSANPAYTYGDTGTYVVMYVAIDSSTCNIADTAYFTVNVIKNDSLIALFTFPDPEPCADSMLVQLQFIGNGADSLYWDMGDGTQFYNDTSINYYYTTPGTYILTFQAYDTLCGDTVTIIDTVFFNPQYTTVTAVVPPNILLCTTPLIVNFTGNNPAPQDGSWWDFGDGLGTSWLNSPAYTYGDSGTYTVIYVVIDSSTCNIADTARFTVTLIKAPPFSATINFDPPPPCGVDSFFVELKFTGIGADSLIWDMGDGTIFTNIDSIFYLYSGAGTFNITMTAFNFLCNFIVSIPGEVTFTDIDATESTIPNVFTPNGDGMNDVLEFVGVDNTEEYSIKIYNRWGSQVYEGTNALAHWDGGGHDAGTYYYILKFTDICNNEDTMSKGTITLLK